MMGGVSMIKLLDINVQYKGISILKTPSLKMNQGEFIGIYGESGSGKSSLLKLLATSRLDWCTSYQVDDQIITKENKNDFCKHQLFYIHQDLQNLEDLNCYDQMRFYALFNHQPMDNERIQEIFNEVELSINQNTTSVQLSGGERQRFLLALAIAKDANIILCDEITSSLDEENKIQIVNILKKLAHDDHKLIVFSTHDQTLQDAFDTIYRIENKELHCIKKAEVESTSITKEKVKENNYFKTYLKGKWKQQKGSKLFQIILVSVCLILCILGYQFSSQYSDQLDALNATINQNQFYVLNSDGGEHWWGSQYLPLTGLDQIEDVDGVQNAYPFYLYPFYLFDGSSDIIEMKVNGEVKQIERNHIGQKIASYYDENNIQFYCEQNLSGNGIYLSNGDAKLLGIDQLDENTSLTFTLYVPTTYTLTEALMSDNLGNSKIVQVPDVQYEKREVTLPVKGILAYGKVEIESVLGYIPYETMQDLLDEVHSTTSLNEGEAYYDTDTYTVFIDSAKEEMVKQGIESLNENYVFYDLKEETNTGMNSFVDKEKPVRIALSALSIVFVSLLLAYSYYDYKKEKSNIAILKENGLTKKELLQITWIDGLMLLIPTILICLFVISIVMNSASSSPGVHLVIRAFRFKQQLQRNLMLSIVLPIIASLLSQSIQIGKIVHDRDQ